MNSQNDRKIWLNGEIVNISDAKINVLAPTSQFGLNVFEGIRCYWNSVNEKLYAFRLNDHLDRLKNSVKMIEIENPYSDMQLISAFKDIIKANSYEEDIAVRQTIFVDGFGSWHSEGPTGMFVAPIKKTSLSLEYLKNGLNCCVSSWRRISDVTLSPRIKCGANYMNSRNAQREAVRNGYDTAIILNQNNTVSEGPGSCVFLVRDGKLITPLLTDSVLESITRDTLIKIAKDDLKIDVIERTVDRTELYVCEELFLCGSAMEITHISSVDGHKVGDGDVGEITSKLHNLYMSIVRGEVMKYSSWCTNVYE